MDYIGPLQQFKQRALATPQQPYLHQPVDGNWKVYSWGEVDDLARRVASGLQAMGLEQGDRVALLAKNSAEWLIADIGIAMAGMISVPIYATAGANTISYVLEHSDSKALFVGKLDSQSALAAANIDVPTIGFPYAGIEATLSWNAWLAEQTPIEVTADPGLDDAFTIVYTSGSTGKPKGVVLTSRNLAAASNDVVAWLPEGHNRIVSYLPLAHITERSMVTMNSFYSSIEIFYNDSLDTFVDDLRHANPTAFISVPRLWAKFQSKVLDQIPDKKLQRLLSMPFVGKRVAKKIRRQLGFEDCEFFGSGSAPISPELLRWFHRLGVNIAEGWGMSETSGASCTNQPFKASQLGTIGTACKSVELRTSASGELLIRGPSVFKEYYKNPQATAEAFEGDWFKTGDKAVQRSDGAWVIVGRVKEQFKTAKGKYVAPVPIESLLGSNSFIEQSCVLGSGLPQPVALVVTHAGSSVSRDELNQSLAATLESVNAQLESHQRLSNIVVCEEPWTIENDMLTPTLKLKRDRIEARYRQLIENEVAYSGNKPSGNTSVQFDNKIGWITS
ncbi:MAG: AMP-binding protein [Gammaproteobacteria bacterium]|nr:AMP-binding protein [Gammaproteobacteria bacterium]MBT8150398.1 AMP-binding protein [Gammaproteobacteria bacterium]NND38658.1 AMP-binding protein [Pseudomonadales bacterium]NNL11726.1 AMP-binding protein [Pseudomonadales bacterium]